MEDEDILTQEEDDLEKEMRDIEKEEAEEKGKKPVKKTSKEPVETNETYEAFTQPARLGIVNTITGDVIDGFDPKRDEAIVQLGRVILNKLDKIGIASGV